MIRLPRFTLLGLPYHGLRTGNELTLEDEHVIDVTGMTEVPSGGETWLWQHPDPPVQTRTAEQQAADIARHYTWKTYEIHPATSDQYWPYVDGNGVVWRMRVIASKFGLDNDIWIRVILSSRYGVIKFNAPDDPLIAASTLASAFFECTWADAPTNFRSAWMPGFASNDRIGNIGQNTFAADGSIGIVNFGVIAESGSMGTMSGSTVTDVFRIDIAGNGSLDPETFGQGITASITKIEDMTSLIMSPYVDSVATVVDDGIECLPDPLPTCGCPKDPGECIGNTYTIAGTSETTRTETQIWDFKAYHWIDSAGVVQFVRDARTSVTERVDTTTINIERECVAQDDPLLLTTWRTNTNTYSASRSYVRTVSGTLSVGTESYLYSWGASASGPSSSGTSLTNISGCGYTAPPNDLQAAVDADFANDEIAQQLTIQPARARFFQRGVLCVFINNDFTEFAVKFFGYNGGVLNQTFEAGNFSPLRVSYHPVTKEWAFRNDSVDVTWI